MLMMMAMNSAKRVDVQALSGELHGFTCKVNLLLLEVDREEGVSHDMPHDLKVRGPPTKAPIRGIGQAFMSRRAWDKESNRAGPGWIHLGATQSISHAMKIVSHFRWYAHDNIMPEPAKIAICFPQSAC